MLNHVWDTSTLVWLVMVLVLLKVHLLLVVVMYSYLISFVVYWISSYLTHDVDLIGSVASKCYAYVTNGFSLFVFGLCCYLCIFWEVLLKYLVYTFSNCIYLTTRVHSGRLFSQFEDIKFYLLLPYLKS